MSNLKEEPKLQCKDCNDNLTDCTCIEDTVDMKQTPGKETADYIDRHIVQAMVEVAKQKMYSEEEVEDLIYKVCGTVARLQGITLNGNHIDTAYKQFKKK